MCMGEKSDAREKRCESDTISNVNSTDADGTVVVKRRRKTDKVGSYAIDRDATSSSQSSRKHAPPSKGKKGSKRKKSSAKQRHGKDAPSGGIEAILPSLIGVGILVFSIMAQQGFRGRASVAGVDLGTTNSVICVQQQTKGVGTIDCIPDPATNSSIIPSVVSILEPAERPVGPSSKTPSNLVPHPSAVVVGQRAKHRIDSHPHHTLYHAKRVLGRDFDDAAVKDLQSEVEYAIVALPPQSEDHKVVNSSPSNGSPTSIEQEVAFRVDDVLISPQNVGSYVIDHLIKVTNAFLGHDNVKSAVLAVPAKFDALQRQRTMAAFQNAGVKVVRVLEEPTAAALAYGLHKKDGVEKILVYDFGGGTLDLSILHVSDGFCEVIGSDGDDRLGGADFDAAVAGLLSARHSDVLDRITATNVDPEELVASCARVRPSMPLCSVSSFHTLGERLKIDLSMDGGRASAQCLGLIDDSMNTMVDSDSQIPAQSPSSSSTNRAAVGHVCQSLKVVDIELTLEDYDDACDSLFGRAITPAYRLLQDLALETSEIDEIVMVGGTTRMPQVRRLVSQAFGNAQLNTHIDPDVTVAYGAASVID